MKKFSQEFADKLADLQQLIRAGSNSLDMKRVHAAIVEGVYALLVRLPPASCVLWNVFVWPCELTPDL